MARQVALALALVGEMLLWVERAEWGALLLLYGLWAQHSFSSRHLATFTGVLCLSLCTDSLTVAAPSEASGYVTMLLWAVLFCKLAAFSTLLFQ